MPQIIIASGPIIVEDNKVLLNKDDNDNFWKFCGGGIEDIDNDFKETAKREAREEMGIEIEFLDSSPYIFYTEKNKEGKLISIILFHYLAKRVGEIIPGNDTKEWRWLDINALEKENLAPNILPALKHFGFLE